MPEATQGRRAFLLEDDVLDLLGDLFDLLCVGHGGVNEWGEEERMKRRR